MEITNQELGVTSAERITRPSLIIEERAPQNPEISWDEWVGQQRDTFKHWRYEEKPVDPEKSEWPPKMPNLPDQHRRIWTEIPSEYREDILEENKRVRSLKGGRSDGIFYRPGIGYGGALDEILGKIGTYHTIVVTDPVYEGKEMLSWSEGLLPVDYYIRSLALIDAQEIRVTITDNYSKSGRVVETKLYESAEIPAGGMATIDFKVNGVNLTIHLLAEDMTRFHPDAYDILGLGRPTPYNPDKAKDPRYSEDFTIKGIRNLAINGIVDYHEDNFRFLPSYLPPEVFGFKVAYSKDGANIVQKITDVKDRLDGAFKTETEIHEALGALAGSMPGENWAGYFRELNQYREGQREITVDDVIQVYRQRLDSIAKFVAALPSQEAQATLERMRFLFMNPLVTDGQIDEQKIKKINETSDNPDNPTPYEEGSYRRPYFGSPNRLIREHNEKKINIFEYYKRLIKEFYDVFHQFKKPEET